MYVILFDSAKFMKKSSRFLVKIVIFNECVFKFKESILITSKFKEDLEMIRDSYSEIDEKYRLLVMRMADLTSCMYSLTSSLLVFGHLYALRGIFVKSVRNFKCCFSADLHVSRNPKKKNVCIYVCLTVSFNVRNFSNDLVDFWYLRFLGKFPVQKTIFEEIDSLFP